MIRINFDISMPETCAICPLYDEEFYYCHGHIDYNTWEVQDIVRYEKNRPEWCPLIDVRANCDECMLGAPSEHCWRSQCSNYAIKQEKEKQWRALVKEVIKYLEKKYET